MTTTGEVLAPEDRAYLRLQRRKELREIAAFRRTLNRVPDDVILAVGSRILDDRSRSDGRTCVCGWVVRETLARIRNADAKEVPGTDLSGDVCHSMYGGTMAEWQDLYYSAGDSNSALVETALVDRILAAASR